MGRRPEGAARPRRIGARRAGSVVPRAQSRKPRPDEGDGARGAGQPRRVPPRLPSGGPEPHHRCDPPIDRVHRGRGAHAQPTRRVAGQAEAVGLVHLHALPRPHALGPGIAGRHRPVRRHAVQPEQRRGGSIAGHHPARDRGRQRSLPHARLPGPQGGPAAEARQAGAVGPYHQRRHRRQHRGAVGGAEPEIRRRWRPPRDPGTAGPGGGTRPGSAALAGWLRPAGRSGHLDPAQPRPGRDRRPPQPHHRTRHPGSAADPDARRLLRAERWTYWILPLVHG